MSLRPGKQDKILFVTVGSTKFEQLINKILSDEILSLLKKFHFKSLILQIGNGVHEDENLQDLKDSEVKQFLKQGLEIQAYRYKSSIREDLLSADLVISHAGSGSIFESLEANKSLIVVCNENLMDNHQFELAEKMYGSGYLLYTTCSHLDEQINLINKNDFNLLKYVSGNPELFGNYLKHITE